MNQEKIGKFIKKIRKDNNLTQKDLADKLGVTYQAVSKWETGKNVPDISTMKLISEEFNINIDELLEGKKLNKTPNKNKYLIVIIIILLIILIISITTIVTHKNHSTFEFKTISSKCSDFKITGSAAYNKDKTAIYISNIEFCGDDDTTIYKKIECTLYESYDNTKTKISSSELKRNINLEDYLKEVNFNIDSYSSKCKQLTSNTLSLEIQATTTDNKTITYKIPIELNDTCLNSTTS
jgi:transcriptional regulator with XRE-family HTH domain